MNLEINLEDKITTKYLHSKINNLHVSGDIQKYLNNIY